ncbi:hypothetical protein LguiA_013500 [Lonicera macranthoides]
MPHSDPPKVVYQLQFEHHDILGRYFPRFQSQNDARDYGSRFAGLTVICEREFKLDDFRPNAKHPNTSVNVRNWIESRGLRTYRKQITDHPMFIPAHRATIRSFEGCKRLVRFFVLPHHHISVGSFYSEDGDCESELYGSRLCIRFHFNGIIMPQFHLAVTRLRASVPKGHQALN